MVARVLLVGLVVAGVVVLVGVVVAGVLVVVGVVVKAGVLVLMLLLVMRGHLLLLLHGPLLVLCTIPRGQRTLAACCSLPPLALLGCMQAGGVARRGGPTSVRLSLQVRHCMPCAWSGGVLALQTLNTGCNNRGSCCRGIESRKDTRIWSPGCWKSWGG